jgi:hypothetical protein
MYKIEIYCLVSNHNWKPKKLMMGQERTLGRVLLGGECLLQPSALWILLRHDDINALVDRVCRIPLLACTCWSFYRPSTLYHWCQVFGLFSMFGYSKTHTSLYTFASFLLNMHRNTLSGRFMSKVIGYAYVQIEGNIKCSPKKLKIWNSSIKWRRIFSTLYSHQYFGGIRIL